jgi:hypothetical protein
MLVLTGLSIMEVNRKSFEIEIDINNAGNSRTLTVVPEGETFSVLLNDINIAQIERSQTNFGKWHLRFGNLSDEDLRKIEEAIDMHYR